MNISDPDPADLPWYLRPLFRRQQRRYGAMLKPALVWARVPPLYAALSAFYAAFERRRSPLPPALRSLVQVRVSQINHCAFCIDLNEMLAAERSGRVEQVQAVAHWRDHPQLFNELERQVLDYAEAMSDSARRVEPGQAAALRERLGEPGLIELTALVAFQNLSAKFNAALDLPSQGLCRLPPR